MQLLILMFLANFSFAACVYVDENNGPDDFEHGDWNGERDGDRDRGDRQCGPECAVCVDGYCESLERPGNECQSDSECSESDICIGGECVECPRTCELGCDSGEQCSSDNYCIPDDRCRSNLDCEDDEICSQNGYCAVPETPGEGENNENNKPECPACETPMCRTDEDCGQGDICVNGACLNTCSDDADCGTGQVCAGDANGQAVCVTDPNGGSECLYNDECENGVCENGYCISRCSEDSECGDGEWCDAGSCRPDTRPQPQCRNNGDCEVGEVCSDAKCRTYCTCDEDCEMSDTGSVCDAGACVPADDASPECVLASHCAAGQDCIDGQCI